MKLSRTIFSLALVAVLCLGMAVLSSSPSEALFICDMEPDFGPMPFCGPNEAEDYVGICISQTDGTCHVYTADNVWRMCKAFCL